MDYETIVNDHLKNDADITVAVQPVRRNEADRFGILKRNAEGVITRFAEKSKDPDVLDDLVSRDDPERPFLGSMGIYLFKTEVLFDMLMETSLDDFGHHVIPSAIGKKKIFGFRF